MGIGKKILEIYRKIVQHPKQEPIEVSGKDSFSELWLILNKTKFKLRIIIRTIILS